MKKIFTLILALTLPNVLFSQTKPVDSDGDGFLNISTLDELRWVSENTTDESLYLELDNDIDAADTRNWNVGDHDGNPATPDSAMGWQPFYSKFEHAYIVMLDGKGYSVKNLYINRPHEDYIGFVASSSFLYNIGIENCDITGKNIVGSLAGHCSGTILNCYSTGRVKGGGENTGGLIGQSIGSIANSYSRCTVIGGTKNTGGFVGKLYSGCHIMHSYCAGRVIGGIPQGFAGDHKWTYKECFWDEEVAGQYVYDWLEGSTTEELTTKATFVEAGWNFDDVWAIDADINDGYPYLNDISIESRGVEPHDTDSDGYINISCFSHLQWLSNNYQAWGKNYELDCDIDADSSKLIYGDRGFIPIGKSRYSGFKGIFDGKGYSIVNLYSNWPEREYIGLFGVTTECIIKNIRIEDCEISGMASVGGIIGYCYNNTVLMNCSCSGVISGRFFIGGIVGESTTSTINCCSSEANVSGRSSIGGIVGNNYSTIKNCYNSGTIYGNQSAGGITGVGGDKKAIINCFNIGVVEGFKEIGGIVGNFEDFYDDNGATNSFWDVKASGISKSWGGKGLSTSEMKDKATYTEVGWDFDLVWDIDGTTNNGYPFLNDRSIEIAGIEPVDINNNGYRELSCFAHLQWVSQTPESWGENFEIVSDIDADSSGLINTGLGFLPIGKSINERPFSGNINGNGYTISNFKSLFSGRDEVGLLSNSMDSSRISNLNMVDYEIEGAKYVGAIVGRNHGSVEDCNTKGIMSGFRFVGGVVGYSDETGFLENCHSKVSIIGEERLGGVAGHNRAVIKKCSSIGKIDGIELIGGIIGEAYSGSSAENCFAICDIKAVKKSGGLVGWGAGSLSKSYCVSSMSGYDEIGGIAGRNFAKDYSDCFWNYDVAGTAKSSDNFGVAKRTEDMKTKSTFTDAGWDFENIWAIDGETNDGYPFFRNEPAAICDDVLSEGDFLVYPNPAKDMIHIEVPELVEGPALRQDRRPLSIYDYTGNLVFSGIVGNIDISDLPAGVYFAVVDTGGKIQSSGFIKE
jgi:hypothetical protein